MLFGDWAPGLACSHYAAVGSSPRVFFFFWTYSTVTPFFISTLLFLTVNAICLCKTDKPNSKMLWAGASVLLCSCWRGHELPQFFNLVLFSEVHYNVFTSKNIILFEVPDYFLSYFSPLIRTAWRIVDSEVNTTECESEGDMWLSMVTQTRS